MSQLEKELIDRIIDHGYQKAGDLDYNLVHSLYKLVLYFAVIITGYNLCFFFYQMPWEFNIIFVYTTDVQ